MPVWCPAAPSLHIEISYQNINASYFLLFIFSSQGLFLMHIALSRPTPAWLVLRDGVGGSEAHRAWFSYFLNYSDLFTKLSTWEVQNVKGTKDTAWTVSFMRCPHHPQASPKLNAHLLGNSAYLNVAVYLYAWFFKGEISFVCPNVVRMKTYI